MVPCRSPRLSRATPSLGVAFLLAMGLAIAATAATAREANDLAERGRAFAADQCGACHAIGPTDTSPHAEAPPFREVVTRYPLSHLEEALAEGIVTGHRDMPAFELEPPQIDALIEYLHTLMPRK